MTYTATNEPVEQPGLTLEGILNVIALLDELLPAVNYVTSKYVPLKTADGEPALYVLPKSAVDIELMSAERTNEPGLLVFHPDNLAIFQHKARGQMRLVELRRNIPPSTDEQVSV